MQKKQVVIKGLLFGLLGIVIFSSSVFAQEAPWGWIQILPTKPVGVVVNTGPKIPTTLPLPAADECTKEYNTTMTAVSTYLTDCLSGCNELPDSNTEESPQSLCRKSCSTYYDDTTKSAKETKELCGKSWNGDWDGDWYVKWIKINPDCLNNWQCGFRVYDLLGIEKNTSATLFVQDILLSATFFIGTVITLALLYSGIMFIMAGASGKDPTSAKNGIKYSIIGLLIVVTSYSLIRLIQYIAKGL